MVQFCGAIPPPPLGGNHHDIGWEITGGGGQVCVLQMGVDGRYRTETVACWARVSCNIQGLKLISRQPPHPEHGGRLQMRPLSPSGACPSAWWSATVGGDLTAREGGPACALGSPSLA